MLTRKGNLVISPFICQLLFKFLFRPSGKFFSDFLITLELFRIFFNSCFPFFFFGLLKQVPQSKTCVYVATEWALLRHTTLDHIQ